MLPDLERRRLFGRVRQPAVACQRRTHDAFERTQRRSGRNRIGRVRHHQQRGTVAAPHRTLEAGGNLDAEQHLARSDHLVHLGFRARQLRHLEVRRVASAARIERPRSLSSYISTAVGRLRGEVLMA